MRMGYGCALADPIASSIEEEMEQGSRGVMFETNSASASGAKPRTLLIFGKKSCCAIGEIARTMPATSLSCKTAITTVAR